MYVEIHVVNGSMDGIIVIKTVREKMETCEDKKIKKVIMSL